MLEMVRQTKVSKLLTVSAENKYFKLKLAVKNKKSKKQNISLSFRRAGHQVCSKSVL